MGSRLQRQLGISLGLIAGAISFVLAQAGVRHLFSKNAERDVRSRSVLTSVANEVNKTLPMSVDKDTELVSSVGLDGIFVYNYRLVNVSAADVDGQELAATLKPGITKAACTTPATRDTFLKKGVALRYSYADKDRTYITALDVLPNECGF